ncbi:NAD(P)-binding domain-containing protein [Kitasatospora sp. NPDC096077]|uniref:NADPH-dependent F420 reductase n=1 Tax=Kitasatospora sp. NPDC096077 TaxID=3155544 RepID=UPI003321B066
MRIAIVGAGDIGRALGAGWLRVGHSVTFGARDPGKPISLAGATVTDVPRALADAEAVVLALPAAAVPELAQGHRTALAGKPVIDATVRFGGDALHSRDPLVNAGARYIRAFSTLGWELLADPVVDGVPADQFFTACDADTRATAERLIADIGLRPVYVGGNDTVHVVDGLTRLWFALAVKRGHGRRVALRLLHEDD